MFARGRRLFTVASLLMFLVALAHTMGTFSEPADPGAAAVVDAMKAYRFEIGPGWAPSVFDVQRSLSLTMTVFLVFLGTLNLAVAARKTWVEAGLLRPLAVANAACMWVLGLLYWIYRIPPPLISFVVLAVLFTIAIRTTRSAP